MCLMVTLLLGSEAGADTNPPQQQTSLISMIQTANSDLTNQSTYLDVIQSQMDAKEILLQHLQQEDKALHAALSVQQTRLVPTLRFAYEYGQGHLGTVALNLLFSSDSARTLQENLENIQYMAQQQSRAINSIAAAQAQILRLTEQEQSEVEDLQIAKANVVAEQTLYDEVSPTGDNPTRRMQAMLNQVQEQWFTNIRPQVESVLAELDAKMNQLPDVLPASALTVSLTNAHVNLRQTTLNALLHTDPQLQDVQFYFRTGEIYVFARKSGNMVLISGHLALSSDETRAVFIIDHVAVDGILIPAQMANAWLQAYSFFIDARKIHQGVVIRQVQVQNQVISIDLHLHL